MTAFERMKIREQAAGSTPREEMIYYAKDMVESLLPNDPSYKPDTKVIRNGEVVGSIGIRMDNRKLVNEVPVMEIHDVLDTETKFRRGDLLRVETTEDGITKDDYWLCFEESNFHGIQRDGKAELCNHPLRIQDDDDCSIYDEWCVVSRYKTSAVGEDAGKTIVVGDTRRNILIQYNERTAKLKQGKRFFIDMMGLNNPKPYKLTDLDRTSYIYNGVGCFQLVCAEEQLVEGDRPDLGVCNYREPPLPEPPSIGSCKIVFSGQPTLKVGGSNKIFSAIFYDSDDEIITTLDPSWTLELPPDLELLKQITVVSEIGNEITIKALAGDKAIGMTFTLRVVCEDSNSGLFQAEQQIEIIELF